MLASHAPQIRLHDPGIEGVPRLRPAYDALILPKRTAAEGTLSIDQTTLALWEEHTSDPPVAEIRDENLLAFLVRLKELGYRSATIRKYHTALRTMFRRLCRRDGGNPRGIPEGKHLMEFVPYVDPAMYADAGEPIMKRAATLDELDAIYRACRIAKWPATTNVPPPLWWRVLFVVLLNVGPRRVDLVWEHAIRWEHHVFWQPEFPDPRISVTSPHGWLRWLPRKTRRSKPAKLAVPLNEVTRRHLQAVARVEGRLFECPKKGTYRTLYAIQREAGIKQPYTLQDLRVTCNTHHDRIPGHRGIGKAFTGHAKRDINSLFYLQELEEMVEAAAKLPQPKAFIEGLAEL